MLNTTIAGDEKNTYNDLPLSPKQARSIVRSTARVNVLSGAIRSGKTWASSIAWFKFVIDAPPGGALVMVGRTRDSIYRNVIAPMMDKEIFGKLAEHVRYTPSSPTAVIMGKPVYVMGAHDINAEKVVRGLTLSGAYVDEVTIVPEAFFTQLLGRMSVPGARCFCTANPDNPNHWFKKKYLDKIGTGENQLDDWKAWYFQLNDNPSLTERYKKSIAAEFTGLFYRRFIQGEWVAAEGAVFDMWQPEKHLITPDEIPPISQYHAIGIDYGTTNPTAALLLGVGQDNALYFTDEWRYQPSDLTTRKTDAQLVAGIKEWIEQPDVTEGAARQDAYVVCDPAAASFRQQMMAEGIRTAAAKNDVLYGIRLMSSLLSTGKLKISTNCKGLIDEIPGYRWDPKSTDQGQDKVLKENDHSIDAARYAIATTEKLWRRQIDTI